jgi:hypothetical protein
VLVGIHELENSIAERLFVLKAMFEVSDDGIFVFDTVAVAVAISMTGKIEKVMFR